MHTTTNSTVTKTVKVGDIFTYSWGYDQTNVDFYQVVRCTTKTVWVRRVNSTCVGGHNSPSEQVVPVRGSWHRYDKKTHRKRLGTGWRGTPCFSMDHGTASLWDGTPERQTGWGYGH